MLQTYNQLINSLLVTINISRTHSRKSAAQSNLHRFTQNKLLLYVTHILSKPYESLYAGTRPDLKLSKKYDGELFTSLNLTVKNLAKFLKSKVWHHWPHKSRINLLGIEWTLRYKCKLLGISSFSSQTHIKSDH